MAYKIYLINLITTLLVLAVVSFSTEIGDYIKSHFVVSIFLGFLSFIWVFLILVQKVWQLNLFSKSTANLEFTTLKSDEGLTNTYDNDWVDLN